MTAGDVAIVLSVVAAVLVVAGLGWGFHVTYVDLPPRVRRPHLIRLLCWCALAGIAGWLMADAVRAMPGRSCPQWGCERLPVPAVVAGPPVFGETTDSLADHPGAGS